MCFDACPVPACLDYSAARMAAVSPNAKLIFMLRDPVGGAFSAEIMVSALCCAAHQPRHLPLPPPPPALKTEQQHGRSSCASSSS